MQLTWLFRVIVKLQNERARSFMCASQLLFPTITSNRMQAKCGEETTLGKTIQPKAILVEEFSFELTAVQLFKKYF